MRGPITGLPSLVSKTMGSAFGKVPGRAAHNDDIGSQPEPTSPGGSPPDSGVTIKPDGGGEGGGGSDGGGGPGGTPPSPFGYPTPPPFEGSNRRQGRKPAAPGGGDGGGGPGDFR